MRKIKTLTDYLKTFYNDVVIPQLTLNETEYTEKEKIFEKRIEMLQQELSTSQSSSLAEVLHPQIYNITDENDEYMTIIDDEEVAE